MRVRRLKTFLCTQDGDHHVSSQYLNGSPGYEVDGGQHVTSVDQCVPGGSVGGLELHGQGPEAALGGAFEGLAILQQRPVEVEADVGLETLREALQHLCREEEVEVTEAERGGRRSEVTKDLRK